LWRRSKLGLRVTPTDVTMLDTHLRHALS
jgi:hypothetical protein